MNSELSQILETMIKNQAKYDEGILNIVREMIHLVDKLGDRIIALEARVRELEEKQ